MSTSSELTPKSGPLSSIAQDWRKVLALGVLTVATLGVALVALRFAGALLRMIAGLALAIGGLAGTILALQRFGGRIFGRRRSDRNA
ncbi:hypothetical protein GCM10009847_19240 [Leucobacter tardus]|uniref:Uncharacterized protein n=1 Tax=Leucobacter tardus TaxID=501483 RepID=A0A939QI96_9MICO|nr:hypothetical protein [Leucobacter tardus]MBO2990563.1 hypothetical protein [Leucobacter tardus]